MIQANAQTWDEAEDLAREFETYGYQTIIIPSQKTINKKEFSYKIMVVK